MTIIPSDRINCTVVWLLQWLQVVALVYGSHGEQHCITTPIFLSNGNNTIQTQFEQMTIKVMLASNLNLSIPLSQHEDTIIPKYEVMQIPLSCYENLLYIKERLAICNRLLKRSLLFSYGQHDIEWGVPTVYMWPWWMWSIRPTSSIHLLPWWSKSWIESSMYSAMDRLRGSHQNKISHPLQLNV